MVFAVLGIISFGIAFKVYFFSYVSFICFAITFALIGISFLAEYNKYKVQLEVAKQEAIEKLSERYDKQYVEMVFDPSSMENDFKKQYIKYKVMGIISIIVAVVFIYTLISYI